jgi:cytochrome c oxidase cbb3-type subunit 2
MRAPREIVPGSVMPGYPFLAERKLDTDIAARMQALRLAGVPYTDEMIAKASSDLNGQVKPDSQEAKELVARYPKAQVRKFDGATTTEPSELDALVAYLQMLGTLVDFTKFDEAGPNLR